MEQKKLRVAALMFVLGIRAQRLACNEYVVQVEIQRGLTVERMRRAEDVRSTRKDPAFNSNIGIMCGSSESPRDGLNVRRIRISSMPWGAELKNGRSAVAKMCVKVTCSKRSPHQLQSVVRMAQCPPDLLGQDQYGRTLKFVYGHATWADSFAWRGEVIWDDSDQSNRRVDGGNCQPEMPQSDVRVLVEQFVQQCRNSARKDGKYGLAQSTAADEHPIDHYTNKLGRATRAALRGAEKEKVQRAALEGGHTIESLHRKDKPDHFLNTLLCIQVWPWRPTLEDCLA